MSIDQLSYRQLKTFLAVYKHGQGNLAAAELGVTTCAVSRTLSSLREVFSDPLFIRRPNGLLPTEKADEIAQLALRLAGDFEALEKHCTAFDPHSSSGSFSIRAYDEFVYSVQCVIDSYIRPHAPHLRFDVGVLSYDCAQEMASGRIDFGVVYEGFEDERLNSQMFAATGDIYILARRGHPVFSGRLNMECLSNYPVLELDNYKDLACPLLVDLSKAYGRPMQVSGYTESVASAFRLLAESDSITLICNQFTRKFADMVPAMQYMRLEDELIGHVKEMRSAVRPVGNYLVYGNINNSPAFGWVKSKLIYGLGEEWRKAMVS